MIDAKKIIWCSFVSCETNEKKWIAKINININPIKPSIKVDASNKKLQLQTQK